MKYILYNSGEAWIDLHREVQFLRNYIDLEKLKGNKLQKIRFTQEGNMKGYRIAPLLLVNYVENAFKHGVLTYGEASTITIDMKFKEQTLYFKIENDFITKPIQSNSTQEGGIGIANTIKRLRLLYPNNHWLKIDDQNNKFLVELKIKLTPIE
jgi:LytS/YehU family sensor histidine kinase